MSRARLRAALQAARAATLATALAACSGAHAGTGPAADSVAAGDRLEGTNGYVEYFVGDLPLIFAAPHGGSLTPADIPGRTDARCGDAVVTVRDLETAELAVAVLQAFLARTGHAPHVVINRLHRDRLDANRPLAAGACGSPPAELAWREYHGFVEAARARVLAASGSGFFTDLHGHAHAIQRLELGYGLTGAALRGSDASLDAADSLERGSSIATFSRASPLSFSAALRGASSLGALLEREGYPAVPSLAQPAPREGESYFSGGYSTDRHGCAAGGAICGVQLEANFTGVRDTPANRERFARTLVEAYLAYLPQFGVRLPVP
jgi:hypothetical protein